MYYPGYIKLLTRANEQMKLRMFTEKDKDKKGESHNKNNDDGSTKRKPTQQLKNITKYYGG